MEINRSSEILNTLLYHNIVISTKEKSPQETLQRLANYLCGATCEDFSFVEMTNFEYLTKKNDAILHRFLFQSKSL
ncbi:hypothetical protein DBB36_04560 [Flavobacterium sp. WLB]|nr:hypothetical protein AKO67_11775 [Flavobacterium sp. VMW]OWU90647.1 hypothetical protein APR43_11745 [Flavobacterium sp. NLM]PUU71238.1 hypothetical protein DBB36_04560 [Flavobacterium sp. WLB]